MVITVKEVAKHAGVSVATVSRVINGAKNVSPEIRNRVKESIKTLGYFPNNAARSLVRRHAGCIAILLHNLHSPFYSELIRGIEDGSEITNRDVIFCSLGENQKKRDHYLQFLTNGTSDAIILYGSMFTDQPIIEHLYSVNFPFLLVENNFQSLPVNQILIDNIEGARNAVEYLISVGHRRIAHFMGSPNKKVNLERFNGYTEAMQKYGLPIAEDYIKNIFTDYELAYDEAQRMIKQPAKLRPTAIFCSNDRIAAKAIQGILDLGYLVPSDMSVVGFDNQLNCNSYYNGPCITSVKQPLYEIGRDSIQCLTNILEGTQKTPFSKTYKTELVKMATVAPPKAE